MSQIVYVVPVLGLLALVYMFIKASWVGKQDAGEQNMQELASHIANGAMASYVSESLIRNLPAPSANTKLVIEKVEDGKASGYFVMGIMIQGLKPVKKGDAMTETFTDGFSGELKCRFTNIPVY